jgi:Glycosyl hydrolases family 35
MHRSRGSRRPLHVLGGHVALLALVLGGWLAPSQAGASPGVQQPAQAHTISWDRYSFLLDGERVWLWSAEFHYFRLPSPDLWRDQLQKLKASGFNAVSLYFSWAYHSPAPGVLNCLAVYH